MGDDLFVNGVNVRVHDRGSAHGRDYGKDHDYDHEVSIRRSGEVAPVDTHRLFKVKIRTNLRIVLEDQQIRALMVMKHRTSAAARRRLKENSSRFLRRFANLASKFLLLDAEKRR